MTVLEHYAHACLVTSPPSPFFPVRPPFEPPFYVFAVSYLNRLCRRWRRRRRRRLNDFWGCCELHAGLELQMIALALAPDSCFRLDLQFKRLLLYFVCGMFKRSLIFSRFSLSSWPWRPPSPIPSPALRPSPTPSLTPAPTPTPITLLPRRSREQVIIIIQLFIMKPSTSVMSKYL